MITLILLFGHKANRFFRRIDDFDYKCNYQPLIYGNHDDPVETTFEHLMIDL